MCDINSFVCEVTDKVGYSLHVLCVQVCVINGDMLTTEQGYKEQRSVLQ